MGYRALAITLVWHGMLRVVTPQDVSGGPPGPPSPFLSCGDVQLTPLSRRSSLGGPVTAVPHHLPESLASLTGIFGGHITGSSNRYLLAPSPIPR